MRVIRCDICKRDIHPANPYFVMQFYKVRPMLKSEVSGVPWEKNDICMDCYDKIKDMCKDESEKEV